MAGQWFGQWAGDTAGEWWGGSEAPPVVVSSRFGGRSLFVSRPARVLTVVSSSAFALHGISATVFESQDFDAINIDDDEFITLMFVA